MQQYCNWTLFSSHYVSVVLGGDTHSQRERERVSRGLPFGADQRFSSQLDKIAVIQRGCSFS